MTRTAAWKLRVERAPQRRIVERGRDTRAGHLRERVHAGVGPARAVHLHVRSVNLRKRRFEQALHGDAGLAVAAIRRDRSRRRRGSFSTDALQCQVRAVLSGVRSEQWQVGGA